MTQRKICVVTTSRADFGLLRELMHSIGSDPALLLQVIVSGMHLVPKLGRTWQDIEADGIRIDRKIPMRGIGESSQSNCKSIGRGMIGFVDALSELKPLIMVLLGDRFELLAPAVAALMLQIPIAHIHGGELSEGAIDDSVRHAITKFSSLHFPATEVYRRRVLQMGESPARVFNFGAPGLDQVHRSRFITRRELEQDLRIDLKRPVALVTYHPVTRGAGDVVIEIGELTRAIEASGLPAIFTAANADTRGNQINAYLRSFCERNPTKFTWVAHLGHRRYLSCLRHFAVMVGNSSSGLTEAPSFRLPVVNIGDRQRGRVRAANVIDVSCNEAAILRGLRRAMSPRFQASLRGMRNPYDRSHDGRASERIKNVLRDVDLSGDFLKKGYYDSH